MELGLQNLGQSGLVNILEWQTQLSLHETWSIVNDNLDWLQSDTMRFYSSFDRLDAD